jgi:hypothetical protein
MNKTKVAKFATSTIVGAGVHHITDGIVNSNVNFGDLNSFGKFTVAAARVAIGFAAAATMKKHTDAQIDQLIAAWNTMPSSDEDTPVTA